MKKFTLNITIILFLFSFTSVHAQSVKSVWISALDGEFDVVRNFIENGLSVDARDENDRTPLMMAAFNGHDKIVEWLIKQKAEIDLEDSDGRTALIYSSTCPSVTTVKLILDAGADPNIADNSEGFTSLMFAASEGNIENVKILIEYNADMEIKDFDGDTALNHAYNNQKYEVVEFLSNVN